MILIGQVVMPKCPDIWKVRPSPRAPAPACMLTHTLAHHAPELPRVAKWLFFGQRLDIKG